MELSPIWEFLDEKGEHRKAAYSCRAKGGMKDDMGVQYAAVLPAPDSREAPRDHLRWAWLAPHAHPRRFLPRQQHHHCPARPTHVAPDARRRQAEL
eukprot:3944931-Pleurochrysis_carterae.AAC.1